MKNENRAVFDRGPEPTNYAFDLPIEPRREAGEVPLRPARENLIIRLLASIAMRWRSRRQRAALLELSDEQLKDIGISRCQAYGGYSRYAKADRMIWKGVTGDVRVSSKTQTNQQ